MAAIQYKSLRFLVADDFSNFRVTVSAMLNKLGVQHILTAKDGEEAIALCEAKTFDVIMCDHDLGFGKNGQQVLEELRYRHLINRATVFLLVSADASKSVVMSAYDCEPDDYLTKPFNAQILLHRLNRLLSLRNELLPVYKAIENNDIREAIALLTPIALSEGRHALAAQKLLGTLFIDEGELTKAEKLYMHALEVRQVDWARLGLAKVKQLQNELDVSGDWLEQIVRDNPLFLPAYDVLAKNWECLGDNEKVQDTIQRSVNISPMSILRQQKLAEVAEGNGDKVTAMKAFKHAVKLGEKSCHGRVDDTIALAKVAVEVSKMEDGKSALDPEELLSILNKAKESYPLSDEQQMQLGLLKSRLHVVAGDEEAARESFENVEASIMLHGDAPVELNIDRVSALQDLGDNERADAVTSELVQRYTYDEAALEKLDCLLSEPMSEHNRAVVATINREGIDLYNQELYAEALDCFEKAILSFPKHLGLQLNLIQALIGKLRHDGHDDVLINKLKLYIANVNDVIEPGFSQFKRFEQLTKMSEEWIPAEG